MDRKDGYVRIATTNGHVPDPNVYSPLADLAESQGELVVVGMADPHRAHEGHPLSPLRWQQGVPSHV